MLIKSIILGIIQGLTEFLPVSSSGHLVIASSLLDFELLGSQAIFFDVMLHVGTLFAVIVAMRKELLEMLKSPFAKKTWLLALATLPAGVVGLLFSSYIESMFDISYVFVGLYFTAFILLFAEYFTRYASMGKISYKTAGMMGVMQCFALIPGVSRSGSTMLGGVYCGVEKSEVAKFSFLMSIPIITASAILQIFEFSASEMSSQLAICSVFGGVSAFVFGIVGIKFFLRLLQKTKLKYFSYYLFALATIVMLATA